MKASPNLSPESGGGRVVLFVVNDASFFLSHRLALAVAAREYGYRPLVASPPDTGEGALAAHDIPHVALPLSRGRTALSREAIAAIKTIRLVSTLRPAVIHAITAKPVIVCGLAARILGLPFVAAISGLGHYFIETSLKSRIMRTAIKLGYKVALRGRNATAIFQNETDRGLFIANDLVNPQQSLIIAGSGCQLNDFSPDITPLEPPIVLMPSRMLWTKGVREFVDAARQSFAAGTAARFILLGDPAKANPASVPLAYLKQLKTADGIEWHPHSSDIVRYLAEASIVVLPSYREGFPKTLIDAAAAGRPAVTFDVPGCRDAVISGVTGLVVPAFDVGALADAIAQLISDPERRHIMGQAARSHAEDHFCATDIALRQIALYPKGQIATRRSTLRTNNSDG